MFILRKFMTDFLLQLRRSGTLQIKIPGLLGRQIIKQDISNTPKDTFSYHNCLSTHFF